MIEALARKLLIALWRFSDTMYACGCDFTGACMNASFILMRLGRERWKRLYADHLRPNRCGFERHGGKGQFNAIIRR